MPLDSRNQSRLPESKQMGMQFPVLVAHRGAARVAPENSREAIRLAVECGVGAIELDVRTTKDKHFILAHSEWAELITGRRVRVEEATGEELRMLSTGRTEILELDEALTLAGDTPVVLDMKPSRPWRRFSGDVQALSAVVVRHDPDGRRIWLRSHDTAFLRAVHEVAPLIQLILVLPPFLPGLILAAMARGRRANEWKAPHIRAWDVHRTSLTKGLVAEAHGASGANVAGGGRERKIFVWGIDSSGALGRAADRGADYVITDRIDWAVNADSAAAGYRMPHALRMRGPAYITYEKFLKLAAFKCAAVAALGHAAAVWIPLAFDGQYPVVGSGFRHYPFGPWAFAITPLLFLVVWRLVRQESRQYYSRIVFAAVACAVAAFATTPFFTVTSPVSWASTLEAIARTPSVLALGLLTAGICAFTAVVSFYEPLTRIAYAGRTAKPGDIISYLEHEADGWNTLSMQIFAVALGAMLGVWAGAGAIAAQLVDASRVADGDLTATKFVTAMSVGLTGTAYSLLSLFGVAGSAMRQARLARSEILNARANRIGNPCADDSGEEDGD